MDLYKDICELINKLNQSINMLGKYGKELAETEKEYKIKLRQEALRLRSEKGMPVTLIQQVVYGVPEVADKRFKRDIAEAMRDTAMENINVLKLQIRILENQLQREYGNVNNGV